MIKSTNRRTILPALLLCPALALTACQEAEPAPDEQDVGAAQSEEVAMRYVEAYNARDLEGVGETLADPIAYNGTEYDRDEFLGFVEAYWNSFSVLDLQPTHIIPTDEYVTLRVEMSATGQGEYLGHDVEGVEAEAAEIMLFRVRDGRVTENWSNWDELGFLAQLGIMERPSP